MLAGKAAPRREGVAPSAVGALVGFPVAIAVRGAAPRTAGFVPQDGGGTIVRMSDAQPAFQVMLLQLETPLVYEGASYRYAVARPRYDGEGTDRLAVGDALVCSLKGLPDDRAQSPTPFDRHHWPDGAPLVAEIRKL